MSNSRQQSQTQATGPAYSGRDVRQGDIVLRKPWERGVFAAGLVGVVVLALMIILIGVQLGRAYSDQHASRRPAQVGLIDS